MNNACAFCQPPKFVCAKHAPKPPLSLEEGRKRLASAAERAIHALLRALRTGPPCPHCGKSDADRDPVVIRAAQLVLDRAGYSPRLELEVVRREQDFDGLSADEVVAKCEALLEQARAMRDAERAASATVIDVVLEDADSPKVGLKPVGTSAVPGVSECAGNLKSRVDSEGDAALRGSDQ